MRSCFLPEVVVLLPVPGGLQAAAAAPIATVAAPSRKRRRLNRLSKSPPMACLPYMRPVARASIHAPLHGVQKPPRRANICSTVDPLENADLGLNRAAPTTLVVDLNCAFASIEQQHDPGLRGRPLAIAAYATDAATIVSSSREARDLGIKTGM